MTEPNQLPTLNDEPNRRPSRPRRIMAGVGALSISLLGLGAVGGCAEATPQGGAVCFLDPHLSQLATARSKTDNMHATARLTCNIPIQEARVTLVVQRAPLGTTEWEKAPTSTTGLTDTLGQITTAVAVCGKGKWRAFATGTVEGMDGQTAYSHDVHSPETITITDPSQCEFINRG